MSNGKVSDVRLGLGMGLGGNLIARLGLGLGVGMDVGMDAEDVVNIFSCRLDIFSLPSTQSGITYSKLTVKH